MTREGRGQPGFRRGRTLCVCGAVVLLAAGAWWWVRAEQIRGPMAQSAYVWQRQWSDATCRAVADESTGFDELLILVAEVETADGVKTSTANVDFAAVKRSGKPAGLVIRVGSYRGAFDAAAPVTQAVHAAAEGALKRAAQAGVTVSQLQIDFDCPTRRLTEYARWLAQFRSFGVPLTITALPSWMGSPGFEAVLSAVDGWVLQVHWLDPASGALFDSLAARQAVETAARYGKPFRVALPTYGYRVCRDGAGKVVDVMAEEPLRAEHPSHEPTEVMADPREIASLIHRWTLTRPARMQGVIWFRLPVEGDVRNWSIQTLRAVMQGRRCEADVVAQAVQDASGAWTISLHNQGDAPGRWPAEISISKPILAGDGVNGYTLNKATLKKDFRERPFLPAGRSVTVGWVRTDAKGTMNVTAKE